MKKFLIGFYCLLCITSLHAQTSINILSGTNFLVHGGINVVYSDDAFNFINNGVYTDSGGTTTAWRGMVFSGAGATTLNNFMVNNGDTSWLTSLISVFNTTTLSAGRLNTGSGNLYLRTDLYPASNLVVNGELEGTDQGLVTNATFATGPCPLSTTLSHNVSGTAALYQWQVSPDNTSWSDISGATNINYAATVTATAYYRCNLSTNNSSFNQATPGTLITVTGLPTITASSSVTICTGATTTLSASGAGVGGTYLWSPGTSLTATTGSSVDANPTSTITYTVIGTTSSGCANRASVTVSVNPVPSLTSANNDGPICAGTTLNLTVTGATNVTGYLWNGPVAITSSTSASASVPSSTTSATGTYTVTVNNGSGTGCTATYTTTATVNPVPTSTGATNDGPICVGGTVNLAAHSSDATAWNWVGSDGFTSTIQNPSATPTVTTTYSLTVSSTGTGCNPATVYTTTVTVNPTPIAAPANSGPICIGGTVTLNANPAGGATVYSWSGPSGYSSTLQNPTLTPTVTSVYSLTVTDGSGFSGCNTGTIYTTTVTVNPTPTAAPTNSGPMCIGGTVTLSANPAGGVTTYLWSGSNLSSTTAANPTITPTVTGTYSLTVSSGSASGCSPSTVYTTFVSVYPVPVVAPTSNGPICNGGTVSFSANPSGGAITYLWSGPNLTSTTIQNPTATPTVTSTYSVTTSNSTGLSGCSPTTVYTLVVTVNATPIASPTNSGTVCSGSTVTLTANPGGGASSYAWSGPGGYSSTLQNPTITPSSTSIYSLTVSSGTGPGCSPTTIYTNTVTVNPLPIAAPTNSGPICTGGTVTLTANPSGGASVYSWSGANLSSTTAQNPTATPTTTSVYSLTVTNGSGLPGCSPATLYTTTVTVNPSPSGIAGTASVCSGSSTTLTNSGIGTWLSSNTAVATITSTTGIVTGVAAGTTIISFTLGTGCYTTQVFTVNPLPSAVTVSGGGPACGSATLNASVSGGTIYYQGITSGGLSTATPSVSQLISTSGTYYFRAQSSAGCWGTEGSATVSIRAIAGFTTLCTGTTSTLTDPDGAGTWTSTNTAVATIGSSSGIVSGVSAGTTIVTYVPASGCTTWAVVTVITTPAAITGATTVCAGQNITLNNATSGGVWSSSAPTIATVGSSSGIVTGVVGPLSATISYSFGGSCAVSYTITVNVLAPITGVGSTICQGQTTTLADAASGGTWTSSNASVATVGTGTGVVTGVTTGSATISYSLPNGCVASLPMSVNTITPITGSSNICVGQPTTLSDATSGGSWTSQTPTIASIGSTGIVTGIAGGLSTVISYTLSSGCFTTKTVNVNSLATISGSTTACVGQSTALTDAIPGGTWTSSNALIATVGSVYGDVTGVSAGTVIISYTLASGCNAAQTMTVYPLSPITGPSSVCNGLSITLSDATPGGTWTSSSPTMATVGATSGIVTGAAAGFTPTITYTLGTGCKATMVVTVNALTAISGGASICQAQPITLTNPNAGGTWSSADLAIATIGTSGIITGVSAGTTTISYVLPTGCTSTRIQRVFASQDPTGSSSICTGNTTTLTDAITPGNWTSNNIAVATVGSLTGIVTGIAAGTAAITYKVLASGCRTAFIMTVKNSSGVITGSASLCAGATTTYTDASPSGLWGSDNTAVATVGSASGIVTGIANGTATITYSTGCGTDATKVITVANSAITGTLALCAGSSTTLSNAAIGGFWTSSNTSIATIGTGTGLVSAVSAGTSIISYNNGSYTATVVFAVSDVPAAISGTPSICPGSSTSLSNSVPNGIWSSSDIAVATVGSINGVLTGVSTGTATITYSTGCGTAATITATISNASPITGAGSICVGATATLSNTGGGTWTSSNTSIATINSTSGLVTGIASGTTTISYILGTGCISTAVETINGVPLAISGSSVVCVSSTIALTNATSGGTWTSSAAGNATIGSVSGIVTGVSAGTTTISYITGLGYAATTIITVNPLPASITDATTVCIGATSTLSDAGGGLWSSSDISKATIGSASGIVTGIAVGGPTITYTLPTGCYSTSLLTINPLPTAILGTASVCTGYTTTLSDVSFGGVWSSSDPATATIGSTNGSVSGVAAGSATISYILGTGCYTTTNVTVNASPSAITGSGAVCAGSTTTYSDAGGGIWSTGGGLTGIATVGSTTGIVTGVSAGSLVVTYTLSNGCFATLLTAINPLPSAIGGSLTVCVSANTTLTDGGTGTWSSSDIATATIGSTSGIATGVSAGTTTITYTLNTGCLTTAQLTVNPLPSAISGTPVVCVGLTTTLSGSGGGTWSSSNPVVATIGSASGIVSGSIAGTSIITYKLSTGCYVTTIATVNPNPSAISGSTSVCLGASTTLTDAGGGTWSSSDIATATIGSTSGILTGAGTGTAIITYTLGTSCIATTQVTVNSLPTAISGTLNLCPTGTTTLTSSGGGTWSSSNSSVATAGTYTNIVTGVVAGTATITYTSGIGCVTTAIVTVNPIPGPITGTAVVCMGSTTTLSGPGGGTWSSSNTSVASVGSTTGIVTGNVFGVATISYTPTSGCSATQVVTVNTTPAAIGGSTNQTIGGSGTLTNTTSGGIWTSSNISVATIGSLSGLLTGISGGTATVTYTLSTGCLVTASVVINPVLGITGNTDICIGFTSTLSDATAGGTWTSTNPAVATIGSITGLVTAISNGTSIVSYIVPSVGFRTVIINVRTAPAAITGATSVCAGQTATLTDATPGGYWTSSTPTIATVNSASGVVTGIAGGLTATINYVIATGCSYTTTIAVNSLGAISGATSVCAGQTTTLTNPIAGGSWVSGTAGVATIGSSSGIVTGVSAGTSLISYIMPSGCKSTFAVAVGALSPISGPSSVCMNQSITLTNTGGGTWSSSAPSIASVVSSTGVVTGNAAGLSATITYTLGSGCKATTVVSVNALGTISGTFSACLGQTTTLTNSVSGGTWSSSATGIATVSSRSGVVTGVASGTSIISYIMPTGCNTSAIVSIGNLAPIGGATSVCFGQSVTLTNSIAGGTWTSSAPTIASIVSSTGVVTGNAGNLTAIISYTLGSGCRATLTITVNPLQPISGSATSVCTGQTTTLTDAATGGTWSSSSAGVATIGSASGIVTGVGAGTNTISYILPSGCTATYAMTVNPLSPITGASSVCRYSSITLSNATPGGTWASSAPTIASVVTATGVVTGAAPNLSATLTYTLGTGCRATTVISVNPIPTVADISGPSSVSLSGGTITLTDATGSGVWSSSNIAKATVVAGTGVVSGVALGTATISYTVTNGFGCATSITKDITVGPNPPPYILPVVSVANVCLGDAKLLGENVSGGLWSSDNENIASVNRNTGLVSGLAAGRTLISYTATDGFNTSIALTNLTVNPIPDVVVITAIPGTRVTQGEPVKLKSIIANGVANANYQWLLNGVNITGATNETFTTTNINGGDEVICKAGSQGCSGYTNSNTLKFTYGNVGLLSGSGADDIRIVPNPNTGSFTLKGKTNSLTNENATIEISDMLGQVIYKGEIKTKNGIINEHILLGNNLANGMYLLNIISTSGNKVINFVIEN